MPIITIEPLSSSGLLTLVVRPESNKAAAPVLLFLHGKGEAGASPNEVPMVCVHQSPPWHAMSGRIPEALVIAPQARPIPNEDNWNWGDHVKIVAQFVRERFAGHRVVATGFSRGGLGVLQVLAEYPDLFESWAIVDPQPPRDPNEEAAILASSAIGRGWLRYGAYRDRSPAWTHFAAALEAIVPEANRDVTQFKHAEMALRAYRGDNLSSAKKQNLYDFLQIRF